MPSVTPSELPSLVAETGYPVLTEEYDRHPQYFAQFGTVTPVDAPEVVAPFLGHRELINPGFQRHAEIIIGQEIPAGNLFEGYTVYSSIKKYARAVIVPKEMMSASNGQARVEAMIARAAKSWGEVAPVIKDEFAAGMLQKGTLTAGSAKYFDGSFEGNADPNPSYIYDGLPFFDTAHTITEGTSTFANHTVSLALSSTNLETVLTTMRTTNAIDERGEAMVNQPDLLVVPEALRGSALRILNSELLPGSPNNDLNVLRGTLTPVVNPYLTDAAGAWWVGHSTRGMQFFDSGMPVLETEYDARTQSFLITSTFYFGGSVTDWRPWYCANKAAS